MLTRHTHIITVGLVVLLLLCPRSGYSGFDSSYWLELGLQYRATKKWLLGYGQHIRRDNDGANWENIGSEIYARHRFNKFIAAEGGYRYIFEPLSKRSGLSYRDHWHRFYLGSRVRYRYKRFTFGYRLRYREQFGWPLEQGARNLTNIHTIRNRLKVERRFKKGLRPFISGEVFGRLDSDGFLQKWRATGGVEYQRQRHGYNLFYRREGMLNGSSDPIIAIIGVGYRFRL